MADKQEEKGGTGTDEEVPPVLVVGTVVLVGEEKKEERPEKVEREKKNRNWSIIAGILIVIGLSIFLMVNNQYYQTQAALAGSYTIDRGEQMNPSISAGLLQTPIDGNYSLRTVITNDTSGNVVVAMSLVPQNSFNPAPDRINYKIKSLVLEGKETKRLTINERILPETNVVGVFNSPASKLGHTLSLEISVNKENSSSGSYSGSFFYNVEILRESNGKIYYIKAEDDKLKQEPGFEAVIAIAAFIAIVAIVKRKKE